jgi:hypothetical protein
LCAKFPLKQKSFATLIKWKTVAVLENQKKKMGKGPKLLCPWALSDYRAAQPTLPVVPYLSPSLLACRRARARTPGAPLPLVDSTAPRRATRPPSSSPWRSLATFPILHRLPRSIPSATVTVAASISRPPSTSRLATVSTRLAVVRYVGYAKPLESGSPAAPGRHRLLPRIPKLAADDCRRSAAPKPPTGHRVPPR